MSFNGVVDPSEFRAAQKNAKAMLKKAQKSERGLTDIKRMVRPIKLTAKLGSFKPSMYESNPVYQTDPISSLPAEIKRSIWVQLDEPADRLLFALTCKWNAHYFEDLKAEAKRRAKVEVSKKSRIPGQEPRTRTTTDIDQTCHDQDKWFRSLIKPPTKTDRFNIMYQLQQWINKPDAVGCFWKLCYACLKFRPKHYRNRYSDWRGKEIVLKDPGPYKPKVVKSSMEEGHHCPDCALRLQMELIEHRKDFKELKKIIASTCK